MKQIVFTSPFWNHKMGYMSTSSGDRQWLFCNFSGGKKGEKIKISWVDNIGEKGSSDATIS